MCIICGRKKGARATIFVRVVSKTGRYILHMLYKKLFLLKAS